MSETVYVKFERSKMVNCRDVSIGDVASVFSEDKKIQEKVRAIKLVSIPDVKKMVYVFSVMEIIKRITAECPGIEVNSVGECDFIVEYDRKKAQAAIKGRHISTMIWDGIKIFITCTIVFVGSMFTIMAYNNDVGVNELFGKMYDLVMGGQNTGVLETAYSIGLTFGIVVFYNHFAGKRLSNTPTPVEVQMRSYENDVDIAIMERASRNKEEIDVQ